MSILQVEELNTRRLRFRSGRRDCITTHDRPYKAENTESHPIVVGNGQNTIDFFKNDFDFTGRETVAIMGAHTFGRLHNEISLFKYVWTTRGTGLFNNHFYK